MKKAAWVFLLLASIAAPPRVAEAGSGLSEIHSWLCYYAPAFPSQSVPRYDLYIFQEEGHPALDPLKKQGAKAIGYVSVGELHKDVPAFHDFQKEKALIEENPDWPGAFRVDLRNSKWRNHLLSTLIPGVLSKGFDGVFLDTIDVAHYSETQKGIRGSIDAAVEFIRELRKRYPNTIIVLNNGLFLLDMVGESIDAVVVEDIYTSYDFRKKKYLVADSEWIQERIAPLKRFQGQFHKPVLSLDYAKAKDAKRIRDIARRATAEGFIPYIADIHLTSVFFHPGTR